MKVVEFKPADLSGSFLVVGFPGRGLVGGIAAQYLVRTLGMEFVAGVHSKRLPPSASSVKGRATSPVHVYASDVVCGLDGRCRRLLVAKSDIPIGHEIYFETAEVLLAWAKSRGVTEVAALEGFERRGNPEDVRALLGMHADHDLEKLGILPCEEGVLTSFGAALLLKANAHGFPALCLFAETDGNAPDAKAAARLVRAMNPLVPEIDIEAAPLFKLAEEIQTTMGGEVDQYTEDMRHILHRDPMYG